MKKNASIIICILVLGIVPLFTLQAYAANEKTSSGTHGMMMGEGMENRGHMESRMTGPRAGMRENWGNVPGTLMGKIHLWEHYLIAHRESLKLTEQQVDQIGSALSEQRKYWIGNKAKCRVLNMEIEDMLVKGSPDLTKVEEKVKSVKSLSADMAMKEIRTLENVLSILTPQQQKTAKEFMRDSTFTRRIRGN